MTLYVGTSGWAYPEWKPDFYPPDVSQSRFLSHYARRLDACEINATFYRVQSDKAVKGWWDATPDGFRFAAKAHRRITHTMRMVPNDNQRAAWDEVFSSLRPLGERLSVVLMHYPPHRERDDAALRAVIDALPSDFRFAFEFRNESWLNEEVAEALDEAGATLVVSDTSGDPPPSLPPGPVGYVRLRSETYTEDQRAGWLDLLTAEAEQRDVYAFTKHKGIPVTEDRGGIGLSLWLKKNN
ncbi:MAG: DUF72 domain-containing protein [Actinomycetota bacterium]|nr:DUF72 domain-containing protein [Actinomycetota bacterium]